MLALSCMIAHGVDADQFSATRGGSDVGNRALSVNPRNPAFGRGMHGAAWPVQGSWVSALLPITPVLILAFSVLLPPEFRITIAGQTLYSYRLAGFALLPWLMIRMLRGAYRFTWPDVFILAGCAWMVVSLTMIYGFARGFPSGVAFALDGVLAYFTARLSFRNLLDFRRFLIVLAPIVFGLGCLLIAEAFLHTPFIRNLARSIFGAISAAELGTSSDMGVFSDTRFGLLRATGPFAHPILAGIFFSSLAALYWGAGLRSWPLVAGLSAGLLSFFTLSSAAILSLILIGGLFAYDWLQRSIAVLNWRIFVIVSGVLLALMQVAAPNGIVTVLIRFTLDPQTGFYRLLIWEYASKSVAKYPLFGIGFTPYQRAPWMDDSIDAFWLSLAVRHGLITPVCLLIGTILILLMLTKASGNSADNGRNVYLALAVAIFVMGLVAFTVSFFGAIATWFFLVLGTAASLSFAAGRPS